MTVVQNIGETGPSLPDTLYRQTPVGPQPFDLTGSTARFLMMERFGGTIVLDAPAVIVAPATGGQLRYDWTQNDADTFRGAYVGWWRITLPDDSTMVSPDFDVQWIAHGADVFHGPAMDWCSALDIIGCCPDAEPGACLSSAARMASEFLYQMSGAQFLGQSQAVVRPCRQGGCGFWGGAQILDQGHIVWARGWYDGYGDSCGCSHTPEVRLAGYPVVSIDEVKINGDTISPSTYRLDQARWLVRADGGWWPVCQDLSRPDTDDGTWSVKYTFGVLPPELGRRAAAQLGCEFYKACSLTGDCRLPSGVTQLVRQGVTVSRVANAFDGGGIGLEIVDAFLAAYGTGRSRPAVVWSPDVRYPRRVDE